MKGRPPRAAELVARSWSRKLPALRGYSMKSNGVEPGVGLRPGSPAACGTHRRASSADECEGVSRRGCPGTAQAGSSLRRPPSSLRGPGGSHTVVSGGARPAGGRAHCHQLPLPTSLPPSPQNWPQPPSPFSPPGSNCTDSSRSRGATADGNPDRQPDSQPAALLPAPGAAGTRRPPLCQARWEM